MPINYLHSRLHRVEAGWDPIPHDYAESYARAAWCEDGEPTLGRIESFIGGLSGKRVLDLGGGAGQYAALFARRGAHVTWHDISREYQRIAVNRATSQGLSIDFSLGYLEDAAKFGQCAFDCVFSRMSWYYCRNDRQFSRLLYSLLSPGGVGYIECNTPKFARLRGVRKMQSALNAWTGWKIGHPLPAHGRIAALIQQYPLARLEIDYSSDLKDIVIFMKNRLIASGL